MIDREHLLSLLGDESLVDRAIEIFQSDVPGQLSALQDAIQSGDLETASRMAHSIKTQCAYMGLTNGESLARDIEYQADAGNADGLEEMANDLEGEVSSCF